MRKLRIGMLVVDANDHSSFQHRDHSRRSPVLHTAIHNLLDGLRARDEIEVEVIYGAQDAVDGDDRWEGSLHYVPVAYKPMPVPGLGGPFLARTLALLRYLRKSKPDIIHAQGTERESGLVAALASCPSVLTLHGNMTEIARSLNAGLFSYFGLASALERFALARVSGVHCISSYTRDCVLRRAPRTWIIPNAVSPCYFDIHPKNCGSPRVVCIAGISEWKNPILLIKASEELHAEFPNTQVHFYGACDGTHPYGRAFLDAIEKHPWCVFHGQCSTDLLLTALKDATCAVLPSKQENFGLSLAEAMAAGVPCIGSDTGGIPDVITDQITGLLFPSGDADALADRLIEIHRDRQQAEKMAAAGKEDASKRFTAGAVADAHIKMYREIAHA